MSNKNIQIKSKNILIVEGNDERDLCLLLLGKLGFKCATKLDKIEDDDTIQIINLGGLTDNLEKNKDKVSNILSSSNIEVRKLAFIVDAEEDAQKRFTIFEDYIECSYDNTENTYSYGNNHLFLSTKKDDKTKGSLEDIFLEIILEKDNSLYNKCIIDFFTCSDKIENINKIKNEVQLLKAHILSFIAVKTKRCNSIGSFFQYCKEYLDADALIPLKDFLQNAFK